MRRSAVFFAVVAVFLLNPQNVLASIPYNASDVLGQTDRNGNPTYTTSISNNQNINANGLDQPRSSAIDTINHKLYVTDDNNNRIVVYNLDSSNQLIDRTADYVLGQPDFSSRSSTSLSARTLGYELYVTVDGIDQLLYVEDSSNYRILVFNIASISNYMDASYVLGQPDFTTLDTSCIATSSSLCLPRGGMGLDEINHRLFIGDNGNTRVLMFNLNTDNTPVDGTADYVLGQPDFTTNTSHCSSNVTSTGLCSPWGVGLDGNNHRLFVVDQSNNRVLVFNLDTNNLPVDATADYVLGQSDFTSQISACSINSFNNPSSLSIDTIHNFLYIEEYGNDRIMVFDTSSLATNMDASYVLGQSDFSTCGGGPVSNTTFALGAGVTVDPGSQRAFVNDRNNYRVLIFDTASLANGMDASDVIGQTDSNGNPDFNSSNKNNIPAPNAIGLYTDSDGGANTIDTIHHRLFVSDSDNERILVYKLDSNNNLIDQTADNVIGSDSFTVNDSNVSNAGYIDYGAPTAYDSINNRLFVSDLYDCRVLVFDLSGGITNGMDASYVLGQPDFDTFDCGSLRNQFQYSYYGGLAFDSSTERLFVTDEYDNNRVMVYDVSPANIHNGMDASNIIGGFDIDSSGDGNTDAHSLGSNYGGGLAVDETHQRLFVSDYDNNRIMVFNVDPSHLTDGQDADHVLGQSDFFSSDSGQGRNQLYNPEGLSYDPVQQLLFVEDYDNYRIMIFDTKSISDGEDAIGALGASDLDNYGIADTSQSGLYFDGYDGNHSFDPANRRLYVSDTSNNRIMIFNFVHITTDSLSNPTLGSSYSETIAKTGDQGTVSYSISSGSLPPGIVLSATTGTLSGTATSLGSYSFTVKAIDDNGAIGIFSDTHDYSLTVSVSSSSGGGAPNPNIHDDFKYEVSAGGDYFGTPVFIYSLVPPNNPGDAIPATFIANDASHDSLHIAIGELTPDDLSQGETPIPFPWSQGLNAVGDVYDFQALSAFNGYPIPSFDKPVTIIIPYDQTKLGNIPTKYLRIAYYDSVTKKWKILQNNTVLDTKQHFLANTTTKFSLFVVVDARKFLGSSSTSTNKTKVLGTEADNSSAKTQTKQTTKNFSLPKVNFPKPQQSCLINIFGIKAFCN